MNHAFAYLSAIALGVAAPSLPAQEGSTFFHQEVKPVLEANCVKCHGGNHTKGGLRMTAPDAFREGGDSGAVIDGEKPESSLLLKMVRWTDDEHQMPPKTKLAAEKVAVLEKWVGMGAPYPADARIEYHPAPGEKAETARNEVSQATRNYWAYQVPVRYPLPACADTSWPRQPVDYFVLAKLEAGGLAPVGEASRQQWIRRAYYDLIGLPPTTAEVTAFVNDQSPDAYEKVVDHLLALPQYGEKWGRHWLDLVRFGESNGYERDSLKELAWKYRDYVIHAFNENKPYDRFLVEQLAGDELPDADAETITATGYYRLGTWDDDPADKELALYNGYDDILKTTTETMLGMTMGCARCHDHKIDPIPQRDYYKMLAFFRNIRPLKKGPEYGAVTKVTGKDYEESLADKEKQESAMAAELAAIKKQILAARDRQTGTNGVPLSPLSELSYRFYRSTWDTIPDFDMIKHEDEGQLPENRFTLSPATRQEAMGFVFRGKLLVPQAGSYRFFLDSKDGSRLLINNTEVVRFDGINHPRGTGRSGSITLPAGLANIRIDFFNKLGDPRLTVRWGGPGVGLQTLSEIAPAPATPPAAAEQAAIVLADASNSKGQQWRYTTDRPKDDSWKQVKFDDANWQTGESGFGTRGTPGAKVGTEWATQDIWLRRTFTVTAIPKDLFWNLHHDENVDVYLNGRPVLSADKFSVRYELEPFSPAASKALRQGENILAVHCNQTVGGQYIDIGISSGSMAPDRAGKEQKLNDDQIVDQFGEALIGKEAFQRYQAVKQALAKSRATKIAGAIEIMAVQEEGNAPTHILRRGSPALPGREVNPGFPTILNFPEPVIVKPTHVASSGRRLALANWIVSPENPVTARVMVNRIWQYHFGRGIVGSTSDFGNLGDKPTHPQLLDWLATEFVASDWNMKAMHRMLMLSGTYRMSVVGRDDGLAKDPANDNFWRFNPRRLTAEEVRDSLLNTTGRLNLAMGGPSMYPTLPEPVLKTASNNKWGNSPKEEQLRRSVYAITRRSLLDPMLTEFDKADTDNSCPVRFASILPTQALALLNSDFVNEQAVAFAERLRREKPDNLKEQLAHGFSIAFSRIPDDNEVSRALSFIDEMETKEGLSQDVAMQRFALLLLNLNEFIFVD